MPDFETGQAGIFGKRDQPADLSIMKSVCERNSKTTQIRS